MAQALRGFAIALRDCGREAGLPQRSVGSQLRLSHLNQGGLVWREMLAPETRYARAVDVSIAFAQWPRRAVEQLLSRLGARVTHLTETSSHAETLARNAARAHAPRALAEE
jgi:hypothetical protein